MERNNDQQNVDSLSNKELAFGEWVYGRTPFDSVGTISLVGSEFSMFKYKYWVGGLGVLTGLSRRNTSLVVSLTPSQDELYQWLAVGITGDEVEDFNTSCRIVTRDDDVRCPERWEGNAQQRLKDYLAGLIDASKLHPFFAPIEIRKRYKIVHLMEMNRQHISLDLSEEVSLGFSLEECLVKPYVNDDDDLCIDCLSSEEEAFATFLYNERGYWSGKLELERRATKRQETIEAAISYAKSGGRFTEYWIKKMDPGLAEDISRYFIGGVPALREHLEIILDPKKSKHDRSQEANEYLRNLLYGDDIK